MIGFRSKWQTDPKGIYFGGNNMALSPRALLAIGELYRNGGLHEGRRVLSENWVKRSWEPRQGNRLKFSCFLGVFVCDSLISEIIFGDCHALIEPT